MSTDRRIGLIGAIVGCIGIAVVYIWPSQKRIGWGALVFAVLLGLSWGMMEYKHWRTRPKVEAEKTDPKALEVDLVPSSGPSSTQLLAVKNNGNPQRFHANCTLMDRRNDPNALNRRTYDLAWDRESLREVELIRGESSNLVIATASCKYPEGWAEVSLIGLANGTKATTEFSRWTEHRDVPPEYDLDVSVFGESGPPKTERFVLKCGGRVSALEMVNRPSSLNKNGAAPQINQRES